MAKFMILLIKTICSRNFTNILDYKVLYWGKTAQNCLLHFESLTLPIDTIEDLAFLHDYCFSVINPPWQCF